MIRDVTSWMWLNSAWGSSNGHPMLFASASWEPEFFRRPDRRFTRSFHWFSQRVADSYNTFESLSQADHTRQDNDVYAKRSKSVLEGAL